MPDVIRPPPECSTNGLIDAIERDGAAIVDGFVSDARLKDLNTAIQTSVNHYKPYEDGEPETEAFLGRQTARLPRSSIGLMRSGPPIFVRTTNCSNSV